MNQPLFTKVLIALVSVALVFGLAVTVIMLTLNNPSDQLVTRMISSFGTIFGGLLGFCTGYLAGARIINGQKS